MSQRQRTPFQNMLMIFTGTAMIAGSVYFLTTRDSEPRKEKPQAQLAAPVATPQPMTEPADDADTALGKRLVAGTMTKDDIKLLIDEADENTSITYAHLKKNADKYTGQAWRLRGSIVQISEEDGGSIGQVALDEWGNQIVHFAGRFETEFVENSRVEIVGVLAGNYSYTAVNGWEMTVPQILCAAMTKRGGLDKLADKKHRREETDVERSFRRQGLQVIHDE